MGRPGGLRRFLAAAAAARLDLEIREFPEGTRTAADAARAVGCEIGQIVKSLVFVAEGEPFVALTSGANHADAARLSALMDGRAVRRATAEEAREATGYSIGGTPPFGHRRPLRVFIDRDLLAHDVVWAAPGVPTAVFAIPPDALREASRARPADLKEAPATGRGPEPRSGATPPV